MINKQTYINAINQNIDMVRGDTLAFNFQLTGLEEQEEYEALEVTLAVADHYDDTPLIELIIDDGIELVDYDSNSDTATFAVTIAPNKTKPLDLARYYYDLQIKDTSNVITLMRGRLTLLYDVAD